MGVGACLPDLRAGRNGDMVSGEWRVASSNVASSHGGSIDVQAVNNNTPRTGPIRRCGITTTALCSIAACGGRGATFIFWAALHSGTRHAMLARSAIHRALRTAARRPPSAEGL